MAEPYTSHEKQQHAIALSEAHFAATAPGASDEDKQRLRSLLDDNEVAEEGPEEIVRMQDYEDQRSRFVSHLGPIAVSPEVVANHNEKLKEIREQLGK